MGRLAIVEENGQEGPTSSATANSESGRIPEAVNNNSAAAASATAIAASSTSPAMESENAKRKAGNSDESGYLSEKDDDGCGGDDVSDDGSVEIVFERKGGDRNGNRDGATAAEQRCSSSKRLKTEHQLRTLAEVVVASAASSKSAEGGDAKGKTK